MDVYDPWADPQEVKTEYGIHIYNNLNSENKYSVIILAVSHKQFKSLIIKNVTNPLTIIYDVKGFLPKELFDKFALLPFIQKFTLVGGTALSLQIGHRQSEDLDFIYDGEKIPTTTIKREISKEFPNYKLIREEKDYQLDFLSNRLKLHFSLQEQF
ncbi:MAG: hypothetical protein C0397_03800 [Odoribacter sp.]|nr:hypothetical protein [Odoribacter sp.]